MESIGKQIRITDKLTVLNSDKLRFYNNNFNLVKPVV